MDKPSYTVLLLFVEGGDYWKLRNQTHFQVWEGIAPKLLSVRLDGLEIHRDDMVKRIEGEEGVTVLARIEYNGKVVQRSYESVEYTPEIRGKGD